MNAPRPKLDGIVRLTWHMPDFDEPFTFTVTIYNEHAEAGIWDLHDALIAAGRTVQLEWEDKRWKPVSP